VRPRRDGRHLKPLHRTTADVPEGGADLEDFYRLFRSAGPAEAVARVVGEERLKEAVIEYSKPYVQADGSVLFENKMRYVLAV